jgi:hypothetical protein
VFEPKAWHGDPGNRPVTVIEKPYSPQGAVADSNRGPGGSVVIDHNRWLAEHGIDVTVLEDQRLIDVMTKFIADQPALWNEDIGVADARSPMNPTPVDDDTAAAVNERNAAT